MSTTKQAKRLQRKGIKWIKSRFSKAYRVRLAFNSMMGVVRLHQGITQLCLIRSTKASTPEEKIAKTIAIAETVINTQNAFVNIMKGTKQDNYGFDGLGDRYDVSK